MFAGVGGYPYLCPIIHTSTKKKNHDKYQNNRYDVVHL